MTEDSSGLELARLYYQEAVAPIVAAARPGLRYTAGLLGDCSDVIGLDDAVSRDHGWGPRCQLLLDPDDFEAARPVLDAALAGGLPLRFRGHSTSFARGDARILVRESHPVAHWVELWTGEAFLREYLGVPGPAGLTARDWLAMRSDKLIGVTGGALFRDDLDFEATRRALAFYPDDVRLYLIAAEWTKIAEEQAFPARAGARGDEVGSAIIAARLGESLMRLCFHLERRYAPYSKWFGSAFRRLPAAAEVEEPIARMLSAAAWQERDRYWAEALAAVIALHERHRLIAPGAYRTAPVYLGRPGTGLPAFERGGPPSIERLVDEIRQRITDPEVRALAGALGA